MGMRAVLLFGAIGMLASGWPAGADDDGDAVAIVNGRPIARQRMVEVLVEAHGLSIMQQLIVLELAKQETKRRGLEVTVADVDAEFRSSLAQIAPGVGSEDGMNEENQRKALQILLEDRNISMAEFMIGMERNAHLRKAVKQELRINEATLREEFARTCGERVVVRHIQIDVSDSAALNRALDLLSQGKDFAEVARQVSQNPETAARGGQMEPFTFNDAQYPAALREAAFSLRPGEVSAPIRVERRFHILKLERRIPPQDARFEDMRDQVEARLLERVIPQQMNQLAQELFQNAKIRVLDSELRKEFEALLKRNADAAAGRTELRP
jgi:parvulin-like peptidyl-prolyl isomerase